MLSNLLAWRKLMRADRVEISWDATKSNWLVRIVTGEEVIRRHCKMPKDQAEGYEPDIAVSTRR